MPTLQDLLEQRAALEREIVRTRNQSRDHAVASIVAIMNEHGLALADLGKALQQPRRALAARLVPPKYRDPITGIAWSGRGLKPKWLAAALADGKTLSDFAI